MGVPFQVGLFRGSALTVLPRCRFVPRLQCYRAGRTCSLFPLCSSALQVRPSLAMFQSGSVSGVPPSLSSTLQVRPSLAMLQNGFGQPCSLPIPNAEKRLPALLPGHLSSAWCCQTERSTCRLSHGCTPFRCRVGLRRYGLRCRMALHRVPR